MDAFDVKRVVVVPDELATASKPTLAIVQGSPGVVLQSISAVSATPSLLSFNIFPSGGHSSIVSRDLHVSTVCNFAFTATVKTPIVAGQVICQWGRDLVMAPWFLSALMSSMQCGVNSALSVAWSVSDTLQQFLKTEEAEIEHNTFESTPHRLAHNKDSFGTQWDAIVKKITTRHLRVYSTPRCH
jgi:hypothetical protein